MEQGQENIIQLKGIVRNTTVIGKNDGECEDLINLRKKDGSWRTAGDGKKVYKFNGTIYSQVYIHTCVYRHVLGVSGNTLYWFCNINADGEFEELTDAVEICDVDGTISIEQNGHLITIIDESDDFDYFVFKKDTNIYKELNVDVNGSQDSRKLYPFGKIQFNLYSPIDDDHTFYEDVGQTSITPDNLSSCHAAVLKVQNDATEKNKFLMPFMAIAAYELYDGSFVYASNPILLYPRQVSSSRKGYSKQTTDVSTDGTEKNNTPTQTLVNSGDNESFVYNACAFNNIGDITLNSSVDVDETFNKLRKYKAVRIKKTDFTKDGVLEAIPDESLPSICNGFGTYTLVNGSSAAAGETCYNRDCTSIISARSTNRAYAFGSDIIISIDDKDFLQNNSDLINALCIFVTPQVDNFDSSEDGYKECEQYKKGSSYRSSNGLQSINITWESTGVTNEYTCEAYSYFPKQKDDSDIIYELFHSNFYLLKRYTKYTLSELFSNDGLIDLSGEEDSGALSNLVQHDRLSLESASRESYLPKYVYQYNGKLHIANYISKQYHGYPLDFYTLSNHVLKQSDGNYFKKVIKNYVSDDDEQKQWVRTDNPIYSTFQDEQTKEYVLDACNETNRKFVWVSTELETDDGTQIVSRYIEISNLDSYMQDGAETNFLEDFAPILTFPDFRARKMTIFLARIVNEKFFYWNKSFDLTPHTLLNYSYYAEPELKPISVTWTEDTSFSVSNLISGVFDDVFLQLPDEKLAEEQYANGLKVSSVDNPLYFPVESTYKVGSSEIVAMCANTVAVGTGQTGSAPLYVFCKDGVYAMFVDSSGQLTYSNARALARDVCNNAKSVTPIDEGVVFTTDRGLMMIAGEQVHEIGEPCEGDVCDFTGIDGTAQPDYHVVEAQAFSNIKLGNMNCADTTDFLTYLENCIINYNHNERELMVTNPSKSYSYIMDRDGQWTRRDITASQYVNNYPTSYRIDGGEFFQVDKEINESNNMFLLSQPINLGTLKFKQAFRCIAHGAFYTDRYVDDKTTAGFSMDSVSIPAVGGGRVEVDKSYTATEVFFNVEKDNSIVIAKPDTNEYFKFINETTGEGAVTNMTGWEAGSKLGFVVVDESGNEVYSKYVELTSVRVSDRFIFTGEYEFKFKAEKAGKYYPKFVYKFSLGSDHSSLGHNVEFSTSCMMDYTVQFTDESYLGLYVFGSYDGRKFELVGHNEQKGNFSEIGCTTSRTDVRYMRICLAGNLTEKSRFDFFELTANQSKLLSNKPR